jgi:hypothetical protein
VSASAVCRCQASEGPLNGEQTLLVCMTQPNESKSKLWVKEETPG